MWEQRKRKKNRYKRHHLYYFPSDMSIHVNANAKPKCVIQGTFHKKQMLPSNWDKKIRGKKKKTTPHAVVWTKVPNQRMDPLLSSGVSSQIPSLHFMQKVCMWYQVKITARENPNMPNHYPQMLLTFFFHSSISF